MNDNIGGEWFIQAGPKYRKDKQLLSQEHSSWLSLAYM